LLNGHFKKITFLIFLSVLLQYPVSTLAREIKSDTLTQEVWPEVDAYYRFNQALRLMGAFTATKAHTAYADGALALNLDYFTLRSLRQSGRDMDMDSTRGYYQWFRAGLKYKRPDPTSKNPAPVYSIRTESNTRFYPGWKSLISLRNRFDFQDKSGFWTVIYRPRVTWEKDFRTTYLYFLAYTYVEYYAYFHNGNRNTLSAALGAQVKVSRLIVFDAYYLYQFQHEPLVNQLSAIGIRIRFYMPVIK